MRKYIVTVTVWGDGNATTAEVVADYHDINEQTGTLRLFRKGETQEVAAFPLGWLCLTTSSTV